MGALAPFLLFVGRGRGQLEEVFSMCDYSLHNVKSRPAKVGDKLTTHHFNTALEGSLRRRMPTQQFVFFQERNSPLPER